MVSSLQILGRLRQVTVRQGLVVLVVGTAALAGCGQKGPLFLPVPPPAPALATPAPPPPVIDEQVPPLAAPALPARPASAAR